MKQIIPKLYFKMYHYSISAQIKIKHIHYALKYTFPPHSLLVFSSTKEMKTFWQDLEAPCKV